MDLRSLRTFVAVVDAASFSGAATALGYTQSAVSQQVAGLERDLGVVLLVRRPVGPTPAGAVLLEQARDLLARADAATARVRRRATTDTDTTPPRLALSPGAAAVVRRLPDGLAAVLSRPAAQCADLLARGRVDLVVVDGVTAPSDPLPAELPPGVSVRVLAESGVGVLLPADHPLAGRRSLDLPALAAARWVDAPGAALPLAELEGAGRTTLRRGPAYDGTDAATVAALVAGGAGLAAVPLDAAVGDATVVVALGSPRLTHRVELWHHADDRPVVLRVQAEIGPDGGTR